LIVGAGAPVVTVPPLALFSGIVGAGAGLAVGGLGTEGAGGAVGEPPLSSSEAGGGAIGASAAFSVTRTVSFLSGTLEVCFEGTLDVCLEGVGGSGLSESLMTMAEDKPEFPAGV
jgi:hypothetical protein